jgi:hypothetical protein
LIELEIFVLARCGVDLETACGRWFYMCVGSRRVCAGESSVRVRGEIVDKPNSETPQSSRWGRIVGAYLVLALAGLGLGKRGVWPFSATPTNAATSTPLARVGFALRQDELDATEKGWALIRNDIEAIRRSWKPEDRDVLDLVVALRGLKTGGNTEWLEAEELCRALKWPRCDRGALEELKKRSRP